MKVTKVINHEGKQYQFAAVEKGEGARSVREELGWDMSDCLIFRKDEDEDMTDWQKWFTKDETEVNMNNVTAVIERHIGGR